MAGKGWLDLAHSVDSPAVVSIDALAKVPSTRLDAGVTASLCYALLALVAILSFPSDSPALLLRRYVSAREQPWMSFLSLNGPRPDSRKIPRAPIRADMEWR